MGLDLTQTPLRLFKGFGDSVPLGADTRELFALVSFAVTSLLGFVFPLMATVGDFGELTHDARSYLLSPLACIHRGRVGLR